MTGNLLVWGALVVVAITDAKDHRIPNFWLIFILVASATESIFFLPIEDLFLSLIGGLVLFLIGLFFFLMRAFAPGDVKLLGIVGFLVGWGELVDASYWIAISAGIVGVLFALLFYAAHPTTIAQLYYQYRSKVIFRFSEPMSTGSGKSNDPLSEKVTMPFAPSVVVGLAMYNYF